MPLRLVHQPSDYHGDDRYAVYSGQWACGVIIRQPGAREDEAWSWIVHVGGSRPGHLHLSGWAPSLNVAMERFKADWLRWLDHAGLTDERWVEATDATNGWLVNLNVSRARTIVGLPEGTIVQFDEADAITVREEPELICGGRSRRGAQPTEPAKSS